MGRCHPLIDAVRTGCPDGVRRRQVLMRVLALAFAWREIEINKKTFPFSRQGSG